uniref:TSA: Wollemia nobilis Ref_Wollemi_Transcript_2826_766 transcribed RNA sequence n=1 Tax=Wollemia nobilis TaxID=56998 RepID=A0A0C9S8X1_9CONI
MSSTAGAKSEVIIDRIEYSVKIGMSSMQEQKPRQARRTRPKFRALLLVKELAELFNSFDLNKDRKISLAEVKETLRRLGDNPSEEEIEEIVGDADWNSDNCIDLPEFLRINSKETSVYNTLEELSNAFQTLDTNKDGFVTAEEVHRVLTNLRDPASLEDCRLFVEALDKDGDRKVSIQEFQLLLKSASNVAALSCNANASA